MEMPVAEFDDTFAAGGTAYTTIITTKPILSSRIDPRLYNGDTTSVVAKGSFTKNR
jgi:hypothetical protein